ncbi:hypothetical protein K3495_g15375 [Podosphaera aphanis]|nr:hypothetical protein K3495_g15375 [Podosphaera aphanis]
MRSQADNKISSPLIAGENPNSRSRKNRSSQIRESAMGDFVKLIYTETVDKFGDAWATYQVKYSGFEEWMIYLSSNWLCQAEKWWSGNRYVSYNTSTSKNFKTDPPAILNMLNININNLIELWHRSLKIEYLGSVRKQRIDLLVYLLLEDILPDFCVKVGRIINGLDNPRRSDTEQKQLVLSVALANEIASSFIRQEAVPRGCDHYSKALSCRSFEKEEVRYDIKLNSCLVMTSCTCLYMKKHKSVCKHMFLSRRVLGFSICFDSRATEEIIADDQNDVTSAQD